MTIENNNPNNMGDQNDPSTFRSRMAERDAVKTFNEPIHDQPLPWEIEPVTSTAAVGDDPAAGTDDKPDQAGAIESLSVQNVPGMSLDDIRAVVDEVPGMRISWGMEAARSDGQLAAMLGKIYEAAADAVDGSEAYAFLAAQAMAIPEVKESKKWKVQDQTPEGLFLTILLGVKNRRATKCQWKAVLTAAASCNVKRSAVAFADWVKGAGGIVEAAKTRGPAYVGKRSLAAQTQLRKLAKLSSDLIPADSPYPAIPVPMPNSRGFESGQLALVLVQHADEKAAGDNVYVRPVFTINNTACMVRAIQLFNAEKSAVAKGYVADEKRERKALIREQWLSHQLACKKRKMKPFTLSQFTHEHLYEEELRQSR